MEILSQTLAAALRKVLMDESLVRDPDDTPDLCRPFLAVLPVSGVSITVISASGTQSSLCASDPVSARIDELQFELGEGSQWSVMQSGEPVLLADVRTSIHGDWPIFGAALHGLPVRSLFCIPMRMGAVTVGVATLHCDRPGELSMEQQITALAIGSAIASTAVQRAMQSATEDVAPESPAAPALRREVHQATGMVLVQLGTTATVAYVRLQAYAFATERSVLDVSRDVVAGTLSFEGGTP